MSNANDSRYGSRALAELCNRRTFDEIGSAIYLLGFLRNDQFHRRNPVTYDWLAAQTKFNARTLEGWLRRLRRSAHCRVENGWNGLHISLRVRYAAHVADSDFELIDTRGWQRPLDSDDVESQLYGHHGGGNESVLAYQDANPIFNVEDADGGRQFERLSDSRPPEIPTSRSAQREVRRVTREMAAD